MLVYKHNHINAHYSPATGLIVVRVGNVEVGTLLCIGATFNEAYEAARAAISEE